MTKKEYRNIYRQNQDWIDNIKIIDQVPPKFLNDSETFYKFYYEYKRLGGKSGYFKYDHNIRVFFIITYPIYINGDVKKYKNSENDHWSNREEAFNCFIGYIDNYPEAIRYFQSVDNITPYT